MRYSRSVLSTMRPHPPSSAVLLLILATSLAQDEFQRENDFNKGSTSPSVSRLGPHPPSNFQFGPVQVQTGPQWSVNVFDFIKIKGKPNGGVDVSVQPPQNLFNSANNPQGSDFGNSGVRHFRRRRRSSILSNSKSLKQELQNDEGYQKITTEPNSLPSAGDDKESTIRIGNFTLKTGKDWSLDMGRLKIKAKPGGGIDVKMDLPPPSDRKPPQSGGNPYEDPSVDYPRKRRALDNWLSKIARQSEGAVKSRTQ